MQNTHVAAHPHPFDITMPFLHSKKAVEKGTAQEREKMAKEKVSRVKWEVRIQKFHSQSVDKICTRIIPQRTRDNWMPQPPPINF